MASDHRSPGEASEGGGGATLTTDRIAVEVLADYPAGLTLGAIRPSPTANGILLVQAIATSLFPKLAALPLAVTALR